MLCGVVFDGLVVVGVDFFVFDVGGVCLVLVDGC